MQAIMPKLEGSLGLKRGKVVLVDHDPQWLVAGAAAASEISEATELPANRIQHVGSTSVTGLPAKPILDVVVGIVEPGSEDFVAAQLVSIGYIDKGSGRGSIGRLLQRESSPEIRTMHIHVVEYGTEAWSNYVEFRDALRNDPGLRDRYAETKRRLADRFPNDRRAYRTTKDAFIRSALDALPTDRMDGGAEEASRRASSEGVR